MKQLFSRSEIIRDIGFDFLNTERGIAFVSAAVGQLDDAYLAELHRQFHNSDATFDGLGFLLTVKTDEEPTR